MLVLGRGDEDKVKVFFLFSVAVLGIWVVLERWNPSPGLWRSDKGIFFHGRLLDWFQWGKMGWDFLSHHLVGFTLSN